MNFVAFHTQQRSHAKEATLKLLSAISDGESLTIELVRSHLREEFGMDLLEDTLKETLLILISQDSPSTLKMIESLIKLAIFGAEKKIFSDITMTLFEDLFESIPLPAVESYFLAFEGIFNFILSKSHDYKNSRLKYLSTFVHLLHRFSYLLNPHLSGSILLLLARVLDYFDRSGLNSRSLKRNVSDAESFSDSKLSSSKLFYDHFTSFQNLSRVIPPSSSLNLNHWKSVMSDIESLLSIFESNPLSSKELLPQLFPHSTLPPKDEHISYRIDSAEFRVVLLSQIVFYIEHVITMSSLPTKVNPWKISAEALKSLKSLKDRSLRGLQKIFDNEVYLNTISLVGERERWFLKSKSENMEAFTKEKPPVELSKKRKAPKGIEEPPSKRLNLGNPSLDELWNITADNVACFKDDSYSHVPAIEVFSNCCRFSFFSSSHRV